MKVISYRHGRDERYGAVDADGMVEDLGPLPARRLPGDSPLPTGSASGHGSVPMSDVELLAPVMWPSKIVALGLNYAAHAAEATVQKTPGIVRMFLIGPNAVHPPGATIELPPIDDRFDYEAELAVVIGRRARRVSAADALDYVYGYTMANDVSARVAQTGGNMVLGKGCDSFFPMGPWVVTADELTDPQALDFRCLVNGELRQEAHTRDMLLSVAELVEYITAGVTLEPGDIISTGTTAGVGALREPPIWLGPGDTVRIECDQIGILENTFASSAR